MTEFGEDGELVLPLLFLTFPTDTGSSQQKIIKFEKADLDEGDGGALEKKKNETGSLGTRVERGNMTSVQTLMLSFCLPGSARGAWWWIECSRAFM